MLQIAVVIGTSMVFALFGVVSLIILLNEGATWRKKCLQIIGVGTVTPLIYGMLVFLMSFCEYPLGW